MKNIVSLAFVIGVAATSSAIAADLPRRNGANSYGNGGSSYNSLPIWTGFYVGLNGGVHFSHNTGMSPGLLGGIQAGYNYQINNIMLGAEADLQLAYIKNRVTYPSATGLAIAHNSANYFGTVRGRIGYSFDRFLPYVTAGLAYGGRSNMSLGYATGLGLEYAFSQNVSVKGEYLYTKIKDIGLNVPGYGTPKSDLGFSTLRAGVNYKF